MNHIEIREKFFRFFKQKDHKIYESFSLIPANDPTLMFIGAGMAPFKKEFSGLIEPEYKRITTIQRCIRTDDLYEVGDNSHHTFFEMMGNFSFGNYFKKEAILWAWQLLTEIYKIDKNRLYVSVHPEDEESYNIWKNDIKIKENRIFKIKTNFWGPIGETGPCGPDSEIFYDIVGNAKEGIDITKYPDRFIEIWNLVFTMYYKEKDGNFTLLKNKNIDTGMGLERLAMILQNKNSPYETDLFINIVNAIKTNIPNIDTKSVRIISDHIRAITFILADGIYPSNEGRGYVLRKLIRRALLFAYKSNFKKEFLSKISIEVINNYKSVYPFLQDRKNYIVEMIKSEEKSFLKTLDKGMIMLDKFIKKYKETDINKIAFTMYDTYGFPLELTQEILKQNNIKINKDKVEKYLQIQRENSRKENEKKDKILKLSLSKYNLKSKFIGYGKDTINTKIIAIFDKDAKFLNNAKKNEKIFIILQETPFYGEKGGQIGDKGILKNDNTLIQVYDTKVNIEDIIVLYAKVKEGNIKIGEKIIASINKEYRQQIKRHHTATHILHTVLKQKLGNHVNQAGSYVGEDKLRFDFTHFDNLDKNIIREIEENVNDIILKNLKVLNYTITLDDLKQRDDIIALFDQKYSYNVRVIEIENFSKELCGGTHVNYTGEIGNFKIISIKSIGLGLKRIEAITGKKLMEYINKIEDNFIYLNLNYKIKKEKIKEDIEKLIKKTDKIEKKYNSLKQLYINEIVKQLNSKIEKLNDFNILISELNNADKETISQILDKIRLENKKIIAIIKSKLKDKYLIGAAKTDDIKDININYIIKEIVKNCNGKGGGKEDFAFGSYKNENCKIKEILNKHILNKIKVK